MGTFRIVIDWQTVQPVKGGPFLFGSYDPVFEMAAHSGLQVLPLLYGTPSYVSDRRDRPPLGNQDAKAQWSAFVTALAGRYGHGGSFWLEHPTVPYLPVTDWVPWNEPNLRQYWYPKPDPAKYVQLAALTRAAVRQADPAGHIATAGLFRAPSKGSGISARRYLTKLYAVSSFKKTIDMVTLHIFAPHPEQVLNTVRDVRRVMDQHHDRGTPLAVNELAWATGGRGGKVFRASFSGQAQKLKRSYKLLLRERGKLRLDHVLWLAFRDYAAPPDLWTQHMGLFTSSGNAKPAWYAFAKITGGTP
jgi:hypothetical protein